jgi:heme exporter protein A
MRFDGVALDRGGRRLFESLDLILEPGAALHLTGPNGSGKSSLLRLAAGLLSPAAGKIHRAPAALADDLSALDRELPLQCALAFWDPGTAARAMATFGLDGLAQVPVRLLSAGQLRRASLARVAASPAPVWLLDEPLNALDADGVARLESSIATHRAAGGAVVAASHAPLAGDWAHLELGR